jgi:LacI family transcriptional regulator
LTYLAQDPLACAVRLHDVRHLDGIIANIHSVRRVLSLRGLNVPLVGVDCDPALCRPEWGIPTVSTDNKTVGWIGAEHLIERGLKQLAFCGVPQSRFTAPWCRDRQMGFMERAAQSGLRCSVFADGCVRGNALKRLLGWLQALPKPVGVMAGYDVRGRTVLEACRLLGLLVPEEVAVLGVDNDELMCELSNPPLSSVAQGAWALGYQAAGLLGRLMAGKCLPQLRHVVAPEGIVARRSSDTMAIDDADVAAALCFIRRQACTDIHVCDVTQAVAVSRSKLDVRFRAIIGRTMHAEIQRVRLARAQQLLTATDLPLKQVAATAGFKHVQYMTTIFRQHFGQTPAEHRLCSRR